MCSAVEVAWLAPQAYEAVGDLPPFFFRESSLFSGQSSAEAGRTGVQIAWSL